ncbi:hypothetical protein HanPI659440_Chr09g0330931 [Helianthus annuus]|nr:hypothetical protein HanPI659440_Chr09g0330931 [Helianthus annuus]
MLILIKRFVSKQGRIEELRQEASEKESLKGKALSLINNTD